MMDRITLMLLLEWMVGRIGFGVILWLVLVTLSRAWREKALFDGEIKENKRKRKALAIGVAVVWTGLSVVGFAQSEQGRIEMISRLFFLEAEQVTVAYSEGPRVTVKNDIWDGEALISSRFGSQGTGQFGAFHAYEPQVVAVLALYNWGKIQGKMEVVRLDIPPTDRVDREMLYEKNGDNYIVRGHHLYNRDSTYRLNDLFMDHLLQ